MQYTDVDGIRVYEYVMQPSVIVHSVSDVKAIRDKVVVLVRYAVGTGTDWEPCKDVTWQPLSDFTWEEDGSQQVNVVLMQWLKANTLTDKTRKLMKNQGVDVYHMYN